MLKKLPLKPVRPVGVFLRNPRSHAGVLLPIQAENSGKAPFAGLIYEFTLFHNEFVEVGPEVP
jgi:hypothetical protein